MHIAFCVGSKAPVLYSVGQQPLGMTQANLLIN